MNRTISRNDLNSDEYAPYFQPYMDLVREDCIFTALENQVAELKKVVGSLNEESTNICHSPYTWTIKQVIGHCLDNERVFAYRAARFAVADRTPLPGYEQDDYIANADFGICSIVDLVEEFVALRRSNLLFLKRISPASWDRVGSADGKEISVRAIAFLLVGHLRHHLEIIKQRLAGAQAQS